MHFTYYLSKRGVQVRIGKGTVDRKSDVDVERYLRRRYPGGWWDSYSVRWHSTEFAADKQERLALNIERVLFGKLPRMNRVGGGGGRQLFVRCKAVKRDGNPCLNGAIVGYRGYCGIHY